VDEATLRTGARQYLVELNDRHTAWPFLFAFVLEAIATWRVEAGLQSINSATVPPAFKTQIIGTS
jgi:hypothetical protein